MRVPVLIVCVGLAWASLASAQGAAPGGRAPSAQAIYRDAEKEYASGNTGKALELIDQGLAAAPKDQKLLRLKGTVLFEARDYAGALAAYEAYLATGVGGANRREVQKIVDKLAAVKTTSFEITVANGPADIYIDARSLGVLCRAAPSCSKAWLPGSYAVIAERPGFEPWTGPLAVAEGAVAKLAVKLVEKPSLLTVEVSPPGARVTVDGKPYDGPLEVAAGKHQVVVSLEGHAEQRLAVEAREGQPALRKVTLAPLPKAPVVAVVTPRPATTPPPGPFTTRRKIALAAGAVGVAALGAGIFLGVQANGLDADAYERCPSPAIPCLDAEAANDLNRRARSRALGANIAYGVAGGAAVAAAVLWFTGAPESRVSVAPQVGAVTGMGVAVRF